MINLKRLILIGVNIITLCLLSSCATTPSTSSNPQDPLESINRPIFRFNNTLDKTIFAPVASVYHDVAPSAVQSGISNFFSNLHQVPNVANDLLQGKVAYAMADTWRFLINSTVGLLGLFDVASHMSLPPHQQSFGKTLATWGWKNSSYIVLPFLGPSTIRDTIGIAPDYEVSLWPYFQPGDRNALYVTDKLNLRAQLLPKDKLLKDAFDPYAFVRNAYLQHQKFILQQDQTPPWEPNEHRTQQSPIPSAQSN